MKVKELIDLLEEMPEEFDVSFVVDFERRDFDYMVNRGSECLIGVSDKEHDDRFEKIAEIIAIPPNNTKLILDMLEKSRFAVLIDRNHSDGDHFTVMRKLDN